MSLKRRTWWNRSRLPGPLKLPISYQPRYLSPINEEILAQRLSRIPERWGEGYKQELKTPQLFVAKKVSKKEVEKIVARLSRTKKQETELIEEEEEEISIFEEETEEQEEERKLDRREVEKLVERLSQTSLRSETKSVDAKEKPRPRSRLTALEIEGLTERLSKPKTYVNPNVTKRKEGRFVGKKMTEDEIKGFVQRIAYKGMKAGQRHEKGAERKTLGYFAAWTPCDADFKEWRRVNKDVLSQNHRYYRYY